MDGRVELVGKLEREVGRTMGIGKDEGFLKWGREGMRNGVRSGRRGIGR